MNLMKERYFFFVFLFVISLCLSGQARKRMIVGSVNIRYNTVKDSLNPWNKRKGQISRFIQKQHIDICGLQEVRPDQLSDLQMLLPQYCFVGVPNSNPISEYVPIIYKKKKYECIECGIFNLSETPDRFGVIGWDGKHPRYAVWAKLRDKLNNNTFILANTHLDHIGKMARQKGIELIKKIIIEKSEGLPIIITGDFNCSYNSSAYYAAVDSIYPMVDSYVETNKRKGVSYSYHGFGDIPLEERKRIDFIFVTSDYWVRNVVIPQEKQIEGVYLTDHNPILVSLNLKKQSDSSR